MGQKIYKQQVVMARLHYINHFWLKVFFSQIELEQNANVHPNIQQPNPSFLLLHIASHLKFKTECKERHTPPVDLQWFFWNIHENWKKIS